MYEENFLTNDPTIYGATVLIIFGVLASLFIVYDVCVERRQAIVMTRIWESSAIVSLLEEKVHERTGCLRDTNQRLADTNARLEAAKAAQLQNFAMMSRK